MENKQKQIEEMARTTCNYNAKNFESCVECIKGGLLSCDRLVQAEKLYNAGYRKIPENAVVLTDEELNKELDTIKVVMIVHDDDGERYVSYDDYKEFTDRLGKIARQRKVRIEQLEKLLDDRCDSCIERVRKETAEKFAERLKEKLNEWLEDNEDDDGKIDFGIAEIELIGVKSLEGEIISESLIDEICKEIIGGV